MVAMEIEQTVVNSILIRNLITSGVNNQDLENVITIATEVFDRTYEAICVGK